MTSIVWVDSNCNAPIFPDARSRPALSKPKLLTKGILSLPFGFKAGLNVDHGCCDALVSQHALDLRNGCAGLGMESCEGGSKAVLG